jgi:hypothetical protein
MALSIFKTISLVALFVVSLVPTTAASVDTLAPPVLGQVLAPVNRVTPQAYQQNWMRAHQDEPNFDLVNKDSQYKPVASSVQSVVGIVALHRLAQAEVKKKNNAWNNFVASGVSLKLAAVDWLTNGVWSLPDASDAGIRLKAAHSMERLLTINTAAVRVADKAERKIIIAANIQIVKELYGQNNALTPNVAWWKLHFAGSGEFKGSIEIQRHINTRATLAALIICEITGRGNLADIFTASGMTQTVFTNFITEIDGIVRSCPLQVVLTSARSGATESKGEEGKGRDGGYRTPPHTPKGSKGKVSSSGTPLKPNKSKGGAGRESAGLLSVDSDGGSRSLTLSPPRPSDAVVLPPLFTGVQISSDDVRRLIMAPTIHESAIVKVHRGWSCLCFRIR